MTFLQLQTMLDRFCGPVLELCKNLPIGNENAISVKQLSDLLGVGERRVQDYIAAARASKVPICSKKGGGYFIARNRDEMYHTIRRLDLMAESNLFTLRDCLRAADEWFPVEHDNR